MLYNWGQKTGKCSSLQIHNLQRTVPAHHFFIVIHQTCQGKNGNEDQRYADWEKHEGEDIKSWNPEN